MLDYARAMLLRKKPKLCRQNNPRPREKLMKLHLQDVLPLPHNESMPSNQAILEIDPTEDEGAESDSDSDYVPSDQEDEEFQADFEEDVN
jgi:hypothetical protein